MGQWIDRTETVDLNELFDRMTREELEAYAHDGTLPGWFTDAQAGKEPDESKQDGPGLYQRLLPHCNTPVPLSRGRLTPVQPRPLFKREPTPHTKSSSFRVWPPPFHEASNSFWTNPASYSRFCCSRT
jgi:hypothetical protein